MADIIIPRHIPLKVPKEQIAPAIGDFLMDCGNCGNREFSIHVRPRDSKSSFRGTAHITEVICGDCGRVYKLDPTGGDRRLLAKQGEKPRSPIGESARNARGRLSS
jgi:ribosomal protein S27E